MDREFIGLPEAAEYLGLNERTVRDMARKGVIPVYEIGPSKGRLRFKVADLRDYVESCRRPVAGRVPAEAYRERREGRPDGKPFRFV